MNHPLFSEYAPERCTEHGLGCPGAAGGEHITDTEMDRLYRIAADGVPVSYLRCARCGHRLDDMGGCDSCAADREAAEWEGIDRAG